ncbi:uncharacterized protein LOC118406548 [Branchiostoma floridae]|nr:uncharacterized protein LOC118406548 [Branchiostoma floridae]
MTLICIHPKRVSPRVVAFSAFVFKMARPGDDDFVWSDFDFSDFEDDFEAMEEEDECVEGLSHSSSQSATKTSAAASGRGAFECDVCGKPYKNAGSFRRHKEREHPVSTVTDPEPGTSNTPDKTQVKGAGKASKPRRKLKVKRPTSKLGKEDALAEGPRLVKDAIEEATKYPPWLLTFGTVATPGNKAAKIAADIFGRWATSDNAHFIMTLCSLLWCVISAADTSVLCSSANETMFGAFHKLCTGDQFQNLWNTFMSSLDQIPCPLLHMFVTNKVFEGLLAKKHSVDAPITGGTCSDVDTAMTNAEEQVLRYVAGYIPHALLKHYKKYDNKLAKLYATVLSEWKVDGAKHSSTGKATFLKYTEGWVDKVNRGGLYVVTDQVYLFFRAVEKVVRSTANVQQLRQGTLTGIKDDIMNKLETDFLVNKYWCAIACSITDEKASVALLEKILLYFVNLRCRAFAEAHIAVMRQKNIDAASKKGEKSLRKSLG